MSKSAYRARRAKGEDVAGGGCYQACKPNETYDQALRRFGDEPRPETGSTKREPYALRTGGEVGLYTPST